MRGSWRRMWGRWRWGSWRISWCCRRTRRGWRRAGSQRYRPSACSSAARRWHVSERRRGAGRIRSIWVAGVLVLHALLYGAPHFQRAFSGTREFNVELPWPTRTLFAFAHWWRESSGWLVLTPACLLLLLLVFRATRRTGEAGTGVLMIVSVLLWGGLLAGFALAVFLPLARIMEALSR